MKYGPSQDNFSCKIQVRHIIKDGKGSKMNLLHGMFDNSLGLLQHTQLEDLVRQHPTFSRLQRVNQTSGADRTWPTMRTQRFEHSLGVSELASRFFTSAVGNSDPGELDSFYRHYREAIVDLIGKNFAEPEISSCLYPLFPDLQKQKNLVDEILFSETDFSQNFLHDHTFLIPSNVPQEWRTTHLLLTLSIRLSGLLHDVGHPPFSHVCESVLEAFAEKSKQRLKAKTGTDSDHLIVNGLNTVSEVTKNSEVPLHEQLGVFLTKHIFRDIAIDEAQRSGRGDNARCHLYAVIGHIVLAILKDQESFADLHTIIAGTIDVDRLDYVRRDRLAAGFSTNVEHTRILGGIQLFRVNVEGSNEQKFVFAFPEKAIDALVTLLYERQEEYRRVIQHHNVVKSGALLRESLTELRNEYHKNERRGDQDQSTDSTIPQDISGLWFPFTKVSYGGPDLQSALTQWDDAWLNSMLIRAYTNNGENERLHNMLGELLYAHDNYHSLIKRQIDWEPFHKQFCDQRKEELEPDYSFEDGALAGVDYGPKLIEKLKAISECEGQEILPHFHRLYSVLHDYKLSTEYGVQENLSDEIKNYLEPKASSLGLTDTIVEPSKLKDGMETNVFLYDPESRELDRWVMENDLILEGLRAQAKLSPQYFIYFSGDRNNLKRKTRQKLLEDLAVFLFEQFCHIGKECGYLIPKAPKDRLL